MNNSKSEWDLMIMVLRGINIIIYEGDFSHKVRKNWKKSMLEFLGEKEE